MPSFSNSLFGYQNGWHEFNMTFLITQRQYLLDISIYRIIYFNINYSNVVFHHCIKWLKECSLNDIHNITLNLIYGYNVCITTRKEKITKKKEILKPNRYHDKWKIHTRNIIWIIKAVTESKETK